MVFDGLVSNELGPMTGKKWWWWWWILLGHLASSTSIVFLRFFSQISPITLYSLFVSISKPALEQRLHTQKLLLTWYEFLISIKECHGLCNLWWVVLMAPHPQWFCLPRPHSNRPRSKARDRCSPASAGRRWCHGVPRCPRDCAARRPTASRSAHLRRCSWKKVAAMVDFEGIYDIMMIIYSIISWICQGSPGFCWLAYAHP